MDIIEKMKASKQYFTSTETRVYELIMENINLFCNGASVLMKRNNISQASLTRFCQKVGYNGLNEFRYELSRYAANQQDESNTKVANTGYANVAEQILETYSVEKLQSIAAIIKPAKRVFVSAFHKTSLAAKLLNYNLIDLKYTTIFIQPDDLHAFISNFKKDDVLVFFSVSSQNYKRNINLINGLGKNKPVTILVTLAENHPLKQEFDYTYCIPSNRLIKYYNEPLVSFSIFIDMLTPYL